MDLVVKRIHAFCVACGQRGIDMNLLIVDDQIIVVQGLLKEVDWFQYGIDHVYGATSVAGALNIFETTPIDVLLCDIEMPIETGLSLVAWVNQKKMDTRCILLTAYAKFSYAQESIKLRVFDYILQPAPYTQIASTVQRAVEDLRQSREQEYFTNCGEAFIRGEQAIIGSVLHNWLRCYGNLDEMERYACLGKLPGSERTGCFLIMIQVIRWTKLNNWTPSLLAGAFEKEAEEIFAPVGGRVVITPMAESEFALICWNDDGDPGFSQTIEQQLSLFWNVCQKKFGSVVALYWSKTENREQLQKDWKQLELLKKDNVSRKSEIYVLNKENIEEKIDEPHYKQVNFWAQQLTGKQPNNVEREIAKNLDQMSRANQVDAQNLRMIYQEFLQAFYTALETKEGCWHDVFNVPEIFSAYCDATKSVDHMKKFVHVAVEYFFLKEETPERELFKKIDSYIDNHMETKISCHELANCVFLNADYLNRQIRRTAGCSLKEYIVRRKLEKAKLLLCTTRLPISIVASKVGYSNAAHFSVAYKKQFDITPMQSRNIESK